MIDIDRLSKTATDIIAPMLPLLLDIGKKVAEGAINKSGEDTWDKLAKCLWSKLNSKSKATPELYDAAQKVASFPEDTGTRNELYLQLMKIFSEDPILAAEISQLLAAKFSLNALFPYFRARPFELQRSFDSLITNQTKNFIGRQYIFDEFDAFLLDERNDSGYFIIRGDPGIGKSALIAYLVKNRGYIHHFNIALQFINSPTQFLDNICAQLIERFELHGVAWPPNYDNDGAFLNELLLKASKRLDADEKLIIAIDALDEVDITARPARTNLLFLPESLPKGVFILATTRRKHYIPLQCTNLHYYDLYPESENNLQDLRMYIQFCILNERLKICLASGCVASGEFIEKLLKKSQ